MGSREPSYSIVVPAFNEEEGLSVVLSKLREVVDGDGEVIVVDDGSTDRTASVAQTFPIRLVQHERNKGKGEALKTGIGESRGQIVIWLDADDTYPVDVIPRMLEALRDSYDLVYTSRSLGRTNIPAFNRIGNALFGWMAQTIYGFKPRDPCSGLCGVRKEHLERMGLDAKDFAIEVEIAVKAGRMKLKMLDIPIHYGERIGESKLSGLKDGPLIGLHMLRYVLWRPGNS